MCVCVCVCVALLIQYAHHMHRIILFVASPTLSYFSTLPHKRFKFWKKVIEKEIRVLIFSTNFIWKISHFKNNSARYYHKCKNFLTWSQLLLSDFNENRIFFSDFLKRFKYKISSKSVQWKPSCSIRTDRKTDGWYDETKSRFSKFRGYA